MKREGGSVSDMPQFFAELLAVSGLKNLVIRQIFLRGIRSKGVEN